MKFQPSTNHQLPYPLAHYGTKQNFIMKYLRFFFEYSTKKFNFAADVNKTNRMASKEEVQRFLNQMKEKIKVFGIIYRDDRGKNAQTLIDLEIAPKYRDSVIINIEVEDYSEGPVIDTLHQCGEIRLFGKDDKRQEA